MQSLRERRAVHVDHGKRPVSLNPHRIDHEHVAFVMADGVAIPGRRYARRMRLVHAHIADFMIVRIDDGDPIRFLQHLHSNVPKNKGHSSGPTLIARSRIGHAGQRDFAVFLHDLRRVRL